MLGSRAVIVVGRRGAISRTVVFLGFLGASSLLALAGCPSAPDAAFTELAEARRLTADLRVQFGKATDASNRAVMADTDDQSLVFAHEAEQATHAAQSDVATLGPHLRHLGYPTEIRILEEFGKHFGDYLALDRNVLELAVENTNLKAQRLSFGPAREAADGFRDALEPLGAQAKDRCRVESLVSKAVLAVRGVQILQAPHIAEADDAAMTRMEEEMSALEATAGDALNQIAGLVDSRAQPKLAAAATSLERFKEVSREIVAFSRRNSNVHSLSLSLREKPAITTACDENLRSLDETLAKERFAATR